jgi:GntR family transcriptional regulator
MVTSGSIQHERHGHGGRESEEAETETPVALPPACVGDDPEVDPGEPGHEASINSTMSLVKVDRRAPPALHDQVAAQIRRAVAEGEAKPGERLPPARDLAAVMGVNTNTVLRALRRLRDEGLLEFRRGRGVRVVGTAARGSVLEKAIELVELAGRHGYPRDELLRMIRSLP